MRRHIRRFVETKAVNGALLGWFVLLVLGKAFIPAGVYLVTLCLGMGWLALCGWACRK